MTTTARNLLNIGVGAIGLLLAVYEARRAPFILGLTTLVVLVTIAPALWNDKHRQRGQQPILAIRTGGLLAGGLWIGVYLVLRLTDDGGAPMAAALPGSLNGEVLTAVSILVHGLIGAAAIIGLLYALHAKRAKRAKRGHGRRSRQSIRPSEEKREAASSTPLD